MNKKTFFVTLSTIILLVSTFISPSTNSAMATEINESENTTITDLVFLTQTDEKLEYTYKQNDKEYKIIDIFTGEEEVTSYFYEKDPSTGKYKQTDVIVTGIESDNVIRYSPITKETEIIEVDEVETEVNMFDPTYINPGFSTMTTWEFTGITKGTSKPSKWSISAIGITIAAITKIPATARYINNLATSAFMIGKDVVYYTRWHYKTGNSLSTARTKTSNHIYADSARTKKLGITETICSRTGCTSTSR